MYRNASIYDYFYDKWVDFDQVMDNIPVHVSNANDFLRANKFVEVSDSTYCYLLNIKEYLPAGSVAPYDYASAQIVEMLTNRRKVEFLKKFEEEYIMMQSGAVTSSFIRNVIGSL